MSEGLTKYALLNENSRKHFYVLFIRPLWVKSGRMRCTRHVRFTPIADMPTKHPR